MQSLKASSRGNGNLKKTLFLRWAANDVGTHIYQFLPLLPLSRATLLLTRRSWAPVPSLLSLKAKTRIWDDRGNSLPRVLKNIVQGLCFTKASEQVLNPFLFEMFIHKTCLLPASLPKGLPKYSICNFHLMGLAIFTASPRTCWCQLQKVVQNITWNDVTPLT